MMLGVNDSISRLPRVKPGEILPDDYVRALLRASAPAYAPLPLGGRYTDMEEHFSIRLGDEMIVELPREHSSPSWDPVAMRHLREAAPTWDFDVRLPVQVCEPALGYPHRFEIARWFDASTTLRSPLRTDAARDLGRALAQLHAGRVPADAPPHESFADGLAARLAAAASALDAVTGLHSPEGARVLAERVRDVWESADAAEPTLGHTWITGTLDPRVVMSRHGAFAGLVYWRKLSVGDPVSDLGVAALLFEPSGTDLLLEGYGGDTEDLRARMRAIAIVRALHFALSDNPAVARLGWTRLGEMHLLTDPADPEDTLPG